MRRSTRSAALLLVVGLLAQAQQPSRLLTKKELPLSLELELAQTAISVCATDHIPVHVYVVDADDNVKLLLVGDGAKSSTVDGARRKAYTAVMTGRATIEWQKAREKDPKTAVPEDPTMLFWEVPFRFTADPNCSARSVSAVAYRHKTRFARRAR